MSFEKISKLLKGDTPGRSVELHYSRIGPDDAARRCICQNQPLKRLTYQALTPRKLT